MTWGMWAVRHAVAAVIGIFATGLAWHWFGVWVLLPLILFGVGTGLAPTWEQRPGGLDNWQH